MSSPVRDPWVLLGVERSASDAEIKKAYRAKVKEYHPDRNPGNKEAQSLFAEVARAFTAIKSQDKRTTWISDNERPSEPFGNSDSGQDPFAPPSNHTRQPTAASVIEHNVKISFKEAFTGVQMTVPVKMNDSCNTCGGSGSAPGFSPITCQVCSGRGVHSIGNHTTACKACSGKGFLIEHPCRTCHGEGLKMVVKDILLSIPPGVVDKHTIRVAGRIGAPDVLFRIIVEPSPVFSRTMPDPADLIIMVPITFAEACLGRNVKIPTPEKPIALRVQPGTPSDKALRIPDQGMPRMDDPTKRGHLYARLQVVIPTEMNSQQMRLLTQLSHYDDPEQLRKSLFGIS